MSLVFRLSLLLLLAVGASGVALWWCRLPRPGYGVPLWRCTGVSPSPVLTSWLATTARVAAWGVYVVPPPSPLHQVPSCFSPSLLVVCVFSLRPSRPCSCRWHTCIRRTYMIFWMWYSLAFSPVSVAFPMLFYPVTTDRPCD